jgi:hypothetical protein
MDDEYYIGKWLSIHENRYINIMIVEKGFVGISFSLNENGKEEDIARIEFNEKLKYFEKYLLNEIKPIKIYYDIYENKIIQANTGLVWVKINFTEIELDVKNILEKVDLIKNLEQIYKQLLYNIECQNKTNDNLIKESEQLQNNINKQKSVNNTLLKKYEAKKNDLGSLEKIVDEYKKKYRYIIDKFDPNNKPNIDINYIIKLIEDFRSKYPYKIKTSKQENKILTSYIMNIFK